MTGFGIVASIFLVWLWTEPARVGKWIALIHKGYSKAMAEPEPDPKKKKKWSLLGW